MGGAHKGAVRAAQNDIETIRHVKRASFRKSGGVIPQNEYPFT